MDESDSDGASNEAASVIPFIQYSVQANQPHLSSTSGYVAVGPAPVTSQQPLPMDNSMNPDASMVDMDDGGGWMDSGDLVELEDDDSGPIPLKASVCSTVLVFLVC